MKRVLYAIYGLWLTLLLVSVLQAKSSSESIDNILASIEEKNDLSLKTKKENVGISYIYTRHDLDVMQIRHLSDILKATEMRYQDSRYNNLDPFRFGSSAPFNSSSIKIFIDNQEINSALYGSGLTIVGDMDLSFVDHIEIYALTPSLESSAEPALITIKLYSKKASRDIGGKIELSGSSYSSNLQSFQYADELDKFSYFTYFSRDDFKKKHDYIDGTRISQDRKNYNFFASIYNEDNRLLMYGSKLQKGGLFGFSLDAKPDTSIIKRDNFHIGYEKDVSKLKLAFLYDRVNEEANYFEKTILNYYSGIPVNNLFIKSHSDTYTFKAKYKINYKKYSLLLGEKFRYKRFIFDDAKVDNTKIFNYDYNQELVNTVFAENSYNYIDNAILSLGLSYTINNKNGGLEDQNLWQYKLGHTYLYDDWVFKLFLSHIEFGSEPYLYRSMCVVPGKELKKQKVDTVVFDIKYRYKQHNFSSIIGYLDAKDYIAPNKDNLLDNTKDPIKTKFVRLNWLYKYKPLSSFNTVCVYYNVDGIPTIGDITLYDVVLRHIWSYKKFDIYERLIYNTNSKDKKNYFDLGLGIKYNYNDNLTFAIKGINLLDKYQEVDYLRVDPATLNMLSPAKIDPIDRRIIFSVEWYF